MSKKFFHHTSYLGVEPETRAFMIAAGIPNDGTVFYPSTPQQKTGLELWLIVDARIVSMKTRLGLTLGVLSLYILLKYLYLFIGGTATYHKWNFIDPRDLDAAYRITWHGGVTHNENGITGNATNAYGDTHFIASSVYGSGYHAFGHKRKNYTTGIPHGGQTTATGQDYEWGVNNGASLGNNFTTIVGIAAASIALLRVNGTQFNYVKNGVNTVVSQAFVANPNQASSLLCFSTVSPTLYSDALMQYAWDGPVTVAQAIIINDELDQLQIDLNRV